MRDQEISPRPAGSHRRAVAVVVAVGLLVGGAGGLGAHLLWPGDAGDSGGERRAKPSAAATASATASATAGSRAEP
ncbi:serine/threonine protein kinase, partial [Streptomyces spectabilis]